MPVKGYAEITGSGFDPAMEGFTKDPYLGAIPTLGACRPDIRRRVVPGDHIFLISGKVPGVPQYVVGGFEVAEKISALMAYERFPELRLRKMENGKIFGNIIVDEYGNQHPLDHHDSFEDRIENYVVGCKPIALTEPEEVARGRAETLPVLQAIFGKEGFAPINIIGRGCRRLDHKQIADLRDWLLSLKSGYKMKAS